MKKNLLIKKRPLKRERRMKYFRVFVWIILIVQVLLCMYYYDELIAMIDQPSPKTELNAD